MGANLAPRPHKSTSIDFSCPRLWTVDGQRFSQSAAVDQPVRGGHTQVRVSRLYHSMLIQFAHLP